MWPFECECEQTISQVKGKHTSQSLVPPELSTCFQSAVVSAPGDLAVSRQPDETSPNTRLRAQLMVAGTEVVSWCIVMEHRLNASQVTGAVPTRTPPLSPPAPSHHWLRALRKWCKSIAKVCSLQLEIGPLKSCGLKISWVSVQWVNAEHRGPIFWLRRRGSQSCSSLCPCIVPHLQEHPLQPHQMYRLEENHTAQCFSQYYCSRALDNSLHVLSDDVFSPTLGT